MWMSMRRTIAELEAWIALLERELRAFRGYCPFMNCRLWDRHPGDCDTRPMTEPSTTA
jgi:hypothetical protein